MEDWKKRLEELSFTKGYYFKLGDNGLVEKKDDQLIFNRDVLESFVGEELSKAREESEEDEESYSRFSKCFLDGFSEGYDKSRRRALKEVLGKFGGSVIVGKIDGEWEWQEPELDVWLKEELGKLGEKDK